MFNSYHISLFFLSTHIVFLFTEFIFRYVIFIYLGAGCFGAALMLQPDLLAELGE